jgi:glucose/arabinose dehydrogenase
MQQRKPLPNTLTTLLTALARIGAISCADGQTTPADKSQTSQTTFTDTTKESPGARHHLTVADLPAPYATENVDNTPHMIPRPTDAWPQAPKGFKVELYATGLDRPRLIRTAPNGDLFVAMSFGNKIMAFHGVNAEGKPQQTETFSDAGLKQPFGIAFFPAGPHPKWLYVANTDSIVRYPYAVGDLKARGPAEKIVDLPTGGGHWTRDLAFTQDGAKMLVSVGSHSNVDDTDTHPEEFHRADVLEFTPEGKFIEVYASGIRNCVGEAINPATGELWCSTNERDGLGDHLVPDYITHLQEGGFYGWPWFYMGANQDPRHAGKHPELKDKVLVPDVLLEPHFASLEMTFYNASQFPAKYKGDAFAAEHGSWNAAHLAGYEIIRVPMRDGHATGAYEDFLTGFVTPSGDVWGRPVGVTVAADGSLFVTDDGSSGSIWHIAYT